MHEGRPLKKFGDNLQNTTGQWRAQLIYIRYGAVFIGILLSSHFHHGFPLALGFGIFASLWMVEIIADSRSQKTFHEMRALVHSRHAYEYFNREEYADALDSLEKVAVYRELSRRETTMRATCQEKINTDNHVETTD